MRFRFSIYDLFVAYLMASLNIFRFSKRKRPEYFAQHFSAYARHCSAAFQSKYFTNFFSSSRLHFISNRSDALFRSLALCMLWHAYAAFILLHIESHWIWYDSRLASRKPNEPTRKQHNSTEYIHSHKVLYIIKKRRARTHNIYISSLAHVYFYFLLTFTVFKHSNPTLKIIKIYI